VLAKRDAEGNRDIYSLFDIHVSHNCSEDIEKRKEAYSGNQVVYGDLSNFQRDYLLDKCYGKNILGDRKFENVIVDEVDSMLLDKGNNMLYLSHDLAGLDKLESVYIYIWQWINRPARDDDELCYAFNTKAIKEAVISDLYRLVKKEDIGKLGSELNEQQKNIIWTRLVEAQILDNQGKLLKESIDNNDLKKIVSPEFDSYNDRLGYLLKEWAEREKYIHVPNYLRPFVERHLESWIYSAIAAFFMKAGQDYVVDVDRAGTSPDRNPNITILDRDTGTDQANSQWDEALHQFLQLKHGCKLSMQSLKAVFTSNVSFFKLYKNLYGLTGTLGSQRERCLLQEIYGVDFVTVPTAKCKQFHEEKPILCTSKRMWINRIRDQAKKLTVDRKQSVLIICETVNDVEVLHKAFEEKAAKHVHTYVRDYEDFDIAQGNKELEQGQIIIATNLAGRGTDIKITEGLRKAGGLHVCLTYLPSNIRVEQQAFGRAARSGDKGSGQLIIMDTDGQEYSNSKILNLKKERDTEELHRISNIKAYYETQTAVEEDCFKKFREQYEKLDRMLSFKYKSAAETLVEMAASYFVMFKDNKDKIELKEILLQSCLDKWAFWLDRNSRQIKDVGDERSRRDFYNSLNEFLSQLTKLRSKRIEDLLAWVEENPVQMVKLGKFLCKHGKNEDAIRLFDKVIKEESYFSEVAHYYKAFALAKKIDSEQKSVEGENKESLKRFKKELRETARLLDEHSKFAINAASIIGKIKTNNNESIIQIDAYEEQKKSLANLCYMLSQSIDDILGHNITSQSFVNHDINEELAEDIYKALLREGILKKPRVDKNFSEEKLKIISSGYGIPTKILNDFLSKYKGNEINEKNFHKALKETVPLPSREAFWKLLIQKKVLSEEVKYVVVDVEKLEETGSSLLKSLTDEMNNKELEKQTLELNNEKILLNTELITQQKNNSNVFKKDDFIKTVGKDKYKILKEKGVLSFNRRAHINSNKINSTIISCYDSITIGDFTNRANITESEAEKILAELVERKVLGKKDDSYVLKIKFDEFEQVQLHSCSVYENAVKGLLSVCFAYRIALQKIASQLKKGKFPVHLQLMTKPHQSLILELLEQRVIRPVTVTNRTKVLKEKIEQILRNRSNLVKEGKIEDITKHVVGTLERSRSSLKALKIPHGKLKPLTEFCGQGQFANTEEMHVFSLNGLDQVLELEEKKWTKEMLLNTSIVTAMGISQIAIGTAIELYSVGVMTHVGAAFVNEGVSDLFFAAGALKSGYFSWGDYRQHKLQSLMFTAVTVGIGACFSRGAKVSRFGYKIAGPSFEVGGKKVAETSGTQLIKIVGWKTVGKEVVKSIALKATEGVAFGFANAGADMLIENHLQALCDNIGSHILSNIKQKVEEHNISITLKEAYKILGEEKTRKMVKDLTQSVFTDQNCVEKYLSIAYNIANSVIQGIADAAEKRNKTSNKLELPICAIRKLTVWSDRVRHIASIKGITGMFLGNLDEKIMKQLDSKQKKGAAELHSLTPESEGYKKFKNEMIDHWKSLLHQKVGQVISQHIVSPILKEGSKRLVRYVGKKMQEAYQTHKESQYLGQFAELKHKHEEQLRSRQQPDNRPTIEDNITEKYHHDLIELMKKTRDPDLVASIVREGVPMDMTCVHASIKVVQNILQEHGVSMPTIIVEGDGAIRQTFPSEGTEDRIIRLELKDNHFQLHGSGASETNRSGNNCLHEALAEAIPELRNEITPEDFRNRVADCMQNDIGIQSYIRQSWHQLPISLGAIGGAIERKRSKRVDDPDSSSIDNEDFRNDEEHRCREHIVSKHVVDRFTRFIRFGGLNQRIGENTNVSRGQVVRSGASQFQDQSSNRGREVHAAHVVRAGEIHPTIKNKHKHCYNEIVNFLGHTQNVPKYANEWHGIGGDIDKFQSRNLQNIAKIDFSRSLTAEDASTIKSLINGFVAVVDNRMERGNVSEIEISQLRKARETITHMTIQEFFDQGKKGYSNENTKKYQ
jgi:hypothetical protein